MRLLLAALLSLIAFAPAAHAEGMMMPKPDDRVVFDLSGEDWVTTKTAHVVVNVEAAVSGNNAGTMRAEMTKAVNELAKGDWRLTGFNRSQDSSGLEHWSVTFEARLPENELNGLADTAKKLSKAGMQLSVNDVDFSPTLDEMEAARAAVRAKIYKEADGQLAVLNSALPGRNYRIAMINFTNPSEEPAPMPRVVRGMGMMMSANAAAPSPAAPPMERSEKVQMTARVVFAAAPAK